MNQKKNLPISKALQYFWPFIKPYRWLGLGVIAVSFVGMIVDLAQANLLENLIDTALNLKQQVLFQYVIFFILVLITGLITNFVLKYFYGQFSVLFLHDFRYHTMSHLQKIPISVMEKHHSGDLLSRLTNDISIVQDFVGNSFLDIFKQIIMLIAAASYMAYLNWRLLIVSIFVVPLALIVVNILTKPMRGYYKKANESLGKANATAQDAISGIFTVKAFNLQTMIAKKYCGSIAQELDNNLKAAQIVRWLPPFNILLRAMPTVFCIGYGSFLIVRGEMTPGELIAFNFLLGFVQWPLAFLTDMFNRIRRAMGAVERVVEVLNIPAERTTGADYTRTDSKEALRFEQVTFAYNEGTNVLKDLSFTLAPGQKIAIVGASGCGKSTIFKLLCGNYETHQGVIKVLDHDTREWNLNALRSMFASIAQEIFLFPVSIDENISYGRSSTSREDVIAAAKMANAHEFIMELPQGYDTLVGERGIKLSGGQKQRIALARAIIKNAPVLLLDEPTSALDTHSEALVQEAIERSLINKTAIIIAHRLSTIKGVDRILVMDQGRIVEQGSHEQLFTQNGLYTKLYLKQFNSAESLETVTGEPRGMNNNKG
ncbi:MAG TPA: ABC transporter ATP-binding protein [Bacillota bacterium]|nr:ABC transporter ATP-binding protein [Bacillota bacterium]